MHECKDFTRIREVNLGIGVRHLPAHGGGKWHSQQLSETKGWHMLLLAGNLGTENREDGVTRCKVYFAGRRSQ